MTKDEAKAAASLLDGHAELTEICDCFGGEYCVRAHWGEDDETTFYHLEDAREYVERWQ